MSAQRTAAFTALLLVISATLLSAMIPGGPVETRDFSHYNPLLLGSFNTFLTLLGLLSYGAAWFVWRRQRWALICAGLCGVGYFLVYAADLAQLFPQSPLPMPTALLVMEIAGLLLSLPLMLLPIKLQGANPQAENSGHLLRPLSRTKAVFLLLSLGVLALGIIAFATLSAMGYSTMH